MSPSPLQVLAIDIGGSKSKAAIVDSNGTWHSERERLPTPKLATPKDLLPVLRELGALLDMPFARVGVGFPGVVRDGVTLNAPNLGKGWKGYPLADRLEKLFGTPCRANNDADVQGLAVIEGQGTELVLTLGTGIGSALFRDGVLLPNTELGHLPFKKGQSFEKRLGEAALLARGKDDWCAEILEAIELLREGTAFDQLYLGGGNARILEKRDQLPPGVRCVRNRAGITGAARLWA
ncbi:MAG: chromosome partitioning protein ParA [Planctomycetota bacterium]|nr:MAG: chromosome partitioning protein ParA [Planctomycetota bacterium]